MLRKTALVALALTLGLCGPVVAAGTDSVILTVTVTSDVLSVDVTETTVALGTVLVGHDQVSSVVNVRNTGTLLEVFGLTRADLEAESKVAQAVRAVGARMPTYITLKDVKKRWGHGQEDIFPVAQFEKLWGDMTALPEMACRYVVVPRQRGQQLKEQAQLDGWLRDGSAAYVEQLCEWESW